jgi:hypothetical protein
MDKQPSEASEKRGSEVDSISPGQEQAQPEARDVYVSVWLSREVDKRSRVRSILLSALLGLASAVAVVLFVALLLNSSPLAGFLAAVAMFAVIRHAQFRRLRSALLRGKRT